MAAAWAEKAQGSYEVGLEYRRFFRAVGVWGPGDPEPVLGEWRSEHPLVELLFFPTPNLDPKPTKP